MALAGGGARRRKNRKRIRQVQESVAKSIESSFQRKVTITPTIVGTIFDRGACGVMVSGRKGGQPSVGTKGTILVDYWCMIGGERLSEKRSYAGSKIAIDQIKGFLKAVPGKRYMDPGIRSRFA